MSWGFWRGCGAILFLWAAGFGTLVSGIYKNNVMAPTVEPAPALAVTAMFAAVAFFTLWRWEHRGENRRR